MKFILLFQRIYFILFFLLNLALNLLLFIKWITYFDLYLNSPLYFFNAYQSTLIIKDITNIYNSFSGSDIMMNITCHILLKVITIVYIMLYIYLSIVITIIINISLFFNAVTISCNYNVCS